MESILFYDGLVEWTWMFILLFILIVTQQTIASVTLYLHRHCSHRSITLNPILVHYFKFWNWLTTGMVDFEWTALHRKHHDKVETEEDPHSPKFYGLGRLLRGGSEIYASQSRDAELIEKYGAGIPNDFMNRHVYAHKSKTGKWYSSRRWYGLILNGIAMVVLFGPIGFTIFAFQYMWIPFWAAGVINGIGHSWGYRNYETPDESRNIYPLAFWIGGEELHNNHHGSPNSAKFSHKNWEFDIGWMWICILRFLSYVPFCGLLQLVKVNRTYSKPKELESAVGDWGLMHKYRELFVSSFVSEVIKPTLTIEKPKLENMQKSTRRMIARFSRKNPKLLSEEQVAGLVKELQQVPSLESVFIAWKSFVQNWDTPSGNTKEAVEKFTIWCEEAKQSGVQRLEEFAQYFEEFLPKPAT